jgi:hypothetical protein
LPGRRIALKGQVNQAARFNQAIPHKVNRSQHALSARIQFFGLSNKTPEQEDLMFERWMILKEMSKRVGKTHPSDRKLDSQQRYWWILSL